ncbi:MAG: LPS assembly protein LptD [Pseudomonadota bacterium]
MGVCTYGATAAHAQSSLPEAEPSSNTSGNNDENGYFAPADPSEITFEAEELTYNARDRVATASGDVIVRHDGYTLNADLVTYSEKTGQVTAEGNVEIIDPGGNILRAEDAELSDTLRDGIVTNIQLILTDGSQAAALEGERAGPRVTLRRAVYSPCEVCSDKDTPLWQIKAVRVTYDQTAKRVTYRNAYLELFGVPVAYLPYFSHPDPSVKKASGFLTPEVGSAPNLGITTEIPYFFNLAPNMDLTIAPFFTTQENPVLKAEYRHNVGYGEYVVEGSGTFTDAIDVFGDDLDTNTVRGHIFADGRFRHSDHLRSTFSGRLASDDTYLRRYEISDVDSLRSSYNLEGFYGRSYLTAATYVFEGLRIEDITELTPFALPSFDYYHETDKLIWGSRVKSRFNALALTRTGGSDTQRVSAESAWHLPYTTPNGQLVEVEASIRGDLYRVSDADVTDDPVFAGEDGFEARILPRLVANWRWPLINSIGPFSQTLEPIAQVVIARSDTNPEEIPNEDSRVFDLDDQNLFEPNRFAGLDRFENGIHATYGVNWGLYGKQFDLNVLVGQSYRFEEAPEVFFPGTGLSGNFSDFIGRVKLRVGELIEIDHRIRLDQRSFEVRRNEVDAFLRFRVFEFFAGYINLDRDIIAFDDLEDFEELRMRARLRLTKKWSLSGGSIQDLTNGQEPIQYTGGIRYRDECLEFQINYRRNFTEDRDFEPGTSVGFRITLRNIG